MIRLMLGSPSTKEGRGVEPYGILIIETNGEIRKNDTLRSSFDGADFFQARWNVVKTEISDLLGSEEFDSYSQMQIPTSTECSSCDHLEVCGGGMPLYRWSNARGYNAPSVYCKDHAKVIEAISNRLKTEGAFRMMRPDISSAVLDATLSTTS